MLHAIRQLPILNYSFPCASKHHSDLVPKLIIGQILVETYTYTCIFNFNTTIITFKQHPCTHCFVLIRNHISKAWFTATSDISISTRSIRKQSMTSPLGLEDKTTRIFFVSPFVLLLAYICLQCGL